MNGREDDGSNHSAPVQDPELLANIIRSSVDGVLAFDRECRYTVWNPAMERISGVSASDTLGRCAFDVFPFLKEIEEDRYFYEALAGRQAVARDRRYTVPSTGRYGFFEGRYVPLRGANGDVVGGLAIIRDITDLKEAEAGLLQASKLAAMGELGAGVAHELNQPLTSLTLLVGMLRERMGSGTENSDDLELIFEQLGRMSKIVENVRGFARKTDFQLRPTQASRPARAALALMGESLRMAGIEVAMKIDEELPLIEADATRLQQLILNLLSNALHALEGRNQEKCVEIGARAVDERVEFWVEDTGPGIPQEALPKVFEPFFTTKAPAQGTGLGLSMCYGIVRDHRGEIRVGTSRQGGARIEFWIPVARAAELVSPSSRPSPKRAKRAAKVLVVDDEAVLRRTIGDYLRNLEYAVDGVESASAALEKLGREQVDVVLLDLRMPGGDGRELCETLLARDRKIPIIVMSGFVTEEERAGLLALGVRAVLHKPFDMTQLSDTVAEAVS